MEWKKVTVPTGCKLFKSHTFTYLHKGTTYRLEIDEFSDGTYTGHGEHSTDKSSVIESVSAGTVEQTIQLLISKIEQRHR